MYTQDYSNPFVVAESPAEVRAAFYRRTYAHVAGAFALWLALEVALFASGAAAPIMSLMLGEKIGMLLVFGLFMAASMIAQNMAFKQSKAAQYAGLGIYVLLEAIIFVPILGMVALKTMSEGGTFATALTQILLPAAAVTGSLIAGLTASVFMSKADFSFLRMGVTIGSFVLMGVIIAALCFGVSLGLWFSAAMVVFMAAVILYQTHEIKNRFSADMHVGAALVLFASFMTMFFHVIRIFMNRRD